MLCHDSLLPVALIVLGFFATVSSRCQADDGLTVHQDLEEATARIANLKDKPSLALIEANNGFFQNETIIFKDTETGHEVWSLTREICTDLANIERRTAWSRNGQYISYIGNMGFLDYNTGKIRKRAWAGHSYIAKADGSKRRKLWAMADGKLRTFQDKFNNWDAARSNVLYYPSGDTLWRITLGSGVKDNKAEAIYKFPNKERKVIQEVSDEDFMLVEEKGTKPNCYVINLNKAPSDPYFCLTYPLKGEVHPGSFRFRRSKRIVTGGYERRKGVYGSIYLSFADGKSLKPVDHSPEPYTETRHMGHLWYGPPDDRVGFFGKYNGKSGLWLQMPGQPAVLMADVPDGHVTWCSHDPEWFFAAVGPGRGHYKDQQYVRKLLACNADGKTIKIICRPWDRSRGTNGSYDKYPRPNQSPDATKCWFHSDMLMPTDKFTGSYIAVFRRPYPPVGLDIIPSAKGVALQWKLPKLSYEAQGVRVYRSDDGGKSFLELTDKPLSGTEYRDASVKAGETYIYAVTCQEWSRLESDVTSPTITVAISADGVVKCVATGSGATGWDKSAPAKPAGFSASKRDDGLIVIKWTALADKDLRYYNVYASSTARPAVSQKRLIVSPDHDRTSYIDWTAPKGKPVYYAITAVDRQGNESEPSYASVD